MFLVLNSILFLHSTLIPVFFHLFSSSYRWRISASSTYNQPPIPANSYHSQRASKQVLAIVAKKKVIVLCVFSVWLLSKIFSFLVTFFFCCFQLSLMIRFCNTQRVFRWTAHGWTAIYGAWCRYDVFWKIHSSVIICFLKAWWKCCPDLTVMINFFCTFRSLSFSLSLFLFLSPSLSFSPTIDILL